MSDKKQAIQIKMKLLEMEITQKELAGKLGVNKSMISNVIAGRRKSKKVQEWIKKHLGVAA